MIFKECSAYKTIGNVTFKTALLNINVLGFFRETTNRRSISISIDKEVDRY